jgi:sorbitol/mannitol transport system permease protein
VLPHLARPITVGIMIETIFLLSVFAGDPRHDGWGPGQATTNLAYLVFQQAILNSNVGAASAGGIVAVILANIVAFFLVRLVGKNLDADHGPQRFDRQQALLDGGRLGGGLRCLLPDPLDGDHRFKTELRAYTVPPVVPFLRWTTEQYTAVLEQRDYPKFAMNSIILAGGSTLLALLIAVPAAWGMAFSPTKRTKDLLLWMLSTKMMPAVGVLVPMYLTFIWLGLLDTHFGMIVVLCLANLPIVIWMLFTYFKEIPKDILEAARMDGATTWKEIRFVLTPMAIPASLPRCCSTSSSPGTRRSGPLNLTTIDAAPLTQFIASFSAPAGEFLGEAVSRLDARHRADPDPWLVQPAPARPRADLRAVK